ncbi:NAD(P)-binding domain-containing protein [Rhodobacter sp. Har01]|uniref:pyrroline-5-carboxylate reductase family protein n=1 Tax=Rhodobacter sp. Har01 TaxID=2883999 RepID=UPI001D092A06|nr:NAD(P)-binding domain-containing protein [Rhodobacter sp. Har01]MCB6178082.1 NAD(P)-binding domain-containing protein [Rhodobacter sp. Har01]
MLGILGVGHLAASLLAGLQRAGFAAEDVVLSPRGRAVEMSARYGHALAQDNADLVARTKLVLLAVRPADAPAAVTGLPWRAGQVLVSACAGVPLAHLPVHPAKAMRIMPMTAAEIGASPTVCFPDLAEARRVVEAFGPVIPLPGEADFQVATVSAAVYGWTLDLIRQTADWSAAQGLDAAIARRLNALTFAAAGALAAQTRQPMPDLLHDLVTPGGITERGLQVLVGHAMGTAWASACDAVLEKLNGTVARP